MHPWKDAITLLRLPFFVFLMPIFWFTLSNSSVNSWPTAALIFGIIHFLVYPASNGYNSYYDRDEGSIGGLKHPPKVNQQLYYLVWLLDSSAVVLSLLVSPAFAALILGYILVSKAYSYEGIRLKKYPIISTIVVTFFQGAYTYIMIQVGLGMPATAIVEVSNVLLALFASLFLAGSYPITQIYQHEEDKARGDITLSIKLGIWGTFIFAAIVFLVAVMVLILAYFLQGNLNRLQYFLPFTIPMLGFLVFWVQQVYKNVEAANFDNTMWMNKLSSTSFNLAFMVLCLLQHNIL